MSAVVAADRRQVGRLAVAGCLHTFVADELLPGTGLEPDAFWSGVERLVAELAPRNRALLAERDRLQAVIDGWHREHRGAGHRPEEYRAFLADIGYLVPEPEPFRVRTTGVDAELATTAGPQLVVPVLNARFVLNAANARWGSLYDAVYGTDLLPPGPPAAGAPYDPVRGRQVVAFVRDFLDRTFPLAAGRHADARSYRAGPDGLRVELLDGSTTGLADPSLFRGHVGDPADPTELVLRHHGLHVVLRVDRTSAVGADDPAGVADVEVEAAVTTIVDFEDSVAAVDAEDKVAAYRNWLQLNQGTLTARVDSAGRSFVRTLAEDRRCTAVDGSELVLPARALLLVRNVGHLMLTDAVVHDDEGPVPEGILDAVLTTAAALPGLRADNPLRNSRTGSVYVVKPKMHGPEEVAFTDRLLAGVESLLGLPAGTVKVGVMDEERRTSANLAASLQAVQDRVVFVNTGFLDRTGDEIHTSMEAGPVVRKADMRSQPWITAYEDGNVDRALAAGLDGRGQIGKGMWAMPDRLAEMYERKVEHPLAGASTAWVPSPTAAVVHALHYHQVDVAARQRALAGQVRTTPDALLTLPLGDPGTWSAEDRQHELDTDVQSILGYVVRWVDQGVGCSKVPDLEGVGLMEDRATLRISSQLLANWLHHGVITREQVEESLRRMAAVVDGQNASDPQYRPMTADLDGSIAFATARELVLEGARQPNGYTELVLHRRRRERKAAEAGGPP